MCFRCVSVLAGKLRKKQFFHSTYKLYMVSVSSQLLALIILSATYGKYAKNGVENLTAKIFGKNCTLHHRLCCCSIKFHECATPLREPIGYDWSEPLIKLLAFISEPQMWLIAVICHRSNTRLFLSWNAPFFGIVKLVPMKLCLENAYSSSVWHIWNILGWG